MKLWTPIFVLLQAEVQHPWRDVLATALWERLPFFYHLLLSQRVGDGSDDVPIQIIKVKDFHSSV